MAAPSREGTFAASDRATRATRAQGNGTLSRISISCRSPRKWPRGWQMPGPRAVQNLQMPHPRD